MRIVVLGTGTGVGKTYFTAQLTRALAKDDPRASVLAVKPIETGTLRTRTGAPAGGSDAEILERASRSSEPARPHPLYAFSSPISAHLAARRSGVTISLRRVARWANQIDVAVHGTTLRTWSIIETAGGAFSPVTARATNLDLALRLEPAIWILVAPDALGVLHDVRSTLVAMRALARAPDYVVLSAARSRDASVGTNAAELSRLGLPKPISVLSRNDRRVASLSKLVRALGQSRR